MCLKKKDECQAYQVDYQSGTSSGSNGTCTLFKWLSEEVTTSCISMSFYFFFILINISCSLTISSLWSKVLNYLIEIFSNYFTRQF